jgi:hypothetical protein
MRKFILFIILFFLALLIGHHNATAANWPDSRLDAIASSIAQKPITVYCEDDSHVWDAVENYYGVRADGLTFLTQPVVFVRPLICEALHAILQGEDVGSFYASHAILTLTHESTHQRLNSGNEALVECTAMKLYPTVLTQQFGWEPSFTEVYYTLQVKRVKGKRVTRRIRHTRTTPSIWYAHLIRDATRWDAILPPSYHGATC